MPEQVKCPNCYSKLLSNDKFCSECGQENRNLHISFWDLIKDFLGNNFNFDTKLLITFRHLMFNPGFLAREFSIGKRSTYVSPIRLYLFVSFVYFLLLGSDIGDGGDSTSRNDILKLQNNGVVVTPGTAEHDSITQTSFIYNADPNNPEEIDSLLNRMELEQTTFNRHWIRQVVRITNPNDQKQLLKEMFSNISIAMFFLMPVFAFFLWLFAKRPRPYFLDSVILSLHIHTFTFLIGTLLVLINLFVYDDIATLITLIGIFVYTVFSLKRVYGITYMRSIGRTVASSLIYVIVIFVTMLVLLGISILLF